MSDHTFNLTVYYDGLCYLCSSEISHYRRMKGAENILFVDITNPSFDAAKEGLDPYQIHKTIHARDKDKNILLGVDAFLSIWKEIPMLRFMYFTGRLTPTYLLLKALYSGFAKIRPFLPRKSCENSPYCETK